ncbi:MAG TPA: dTMP kinase, partial [Candidatus Polarisedimenticolia bacterium]|nr:dTMP kinase [Candidatus Polarisedimenticolia bacterium]
MSRFITFEGIEGSGKTTQIQMLSNHFEERGIDHLLTREPGGTRLGDQIRRLVLNPANNDMTPTCEMLLYSAARAQHIEQVIRPALADGRVVLCDRFQDATMAYQGYGRGLPLDLILRLHSLEVLALRPDLTLLFDLEADVALERARS